MNSTHDDHITERHPRDFTPAAQWQSASPTPLHSEPLPYPGTPAGPPSGPIPPQGYGRAYTTPVITGYAVGPDGQPAPYIPGPHHFPALAPPPTNRLAVISLILGIASLVCCGFLAGIPAIITGVKAQRQVARSRGAETGHGMATAGIVLGVIITTMSAVGIFVWVLQGLLAYIAQ